MSECKFCKSDMVGDGITTVRHCPNAKGADFIFEPDANPVYCESDPVERVHHAYSPSTLQSLEACPCYIGRQNETEHERTTAGTRAHGVAESGQDDNRLSDEDAAAAAECLDFVEHHRQLFIEARKREFEKNAPGFDLSNAASVLEVKEAYLPVDDITLPDGTLHTTAGYVDHSLIDHTGTHAKLFDWKFGNWPVEEASNNLQGIAYVLGLAKRYPALNRFEFFFKQPHLNSISHAVWTRRQLPALYLRVQVVVNMACAARAAILRGDWSAARPMVPACNFCGNIGRCPAVAKFACRVGNKFHPLAIPADITPSALHSDRDTTLGLQLAQVVTVWAKAFKTQITDRIIRGEADIPAGQILQTKRDREVSDPVAFRTVALRHITEQQLRDASTIRFGAVEDAIKDKAPRGVKQAAVDSFNEELKTANAVTYGQPYTFLKSKPTTNENEKTPATS